MKRTTCLGVITLLPLLLSLAFGQYDKGANKIYFDITGRNASNKKIRGAGISFSNFQFQWGYLDSYVSKTYSDHVGRFIPDKVLLTWTLENTGREQTAEVSIPPLPARFTGEGSKLVNGRYEGEGVTVAF